MRSNRIVEGGPVLTELPRLEPLWAAVGAPHTARSPWLDCVTQAFPGLRPVLVLVEDGEDVVAAAALSRQDGFVSQWTALGHEVSDYAVLAALDAEAADLLATAVADRLDRESSPWRLRIEQLPAGDPVAARLSERLSVARVVAGTPAARLALTSPRTLDRHVSRNSRRSANQARNRLSRDGHVTRTTHYRDLADIEARLEQLVELHRARDHQLGRRSDLDDPAARSFYGAVVRALARRGDVELTTVESETGIAAFTLAVLDGETYRCWGGRVAPEWTDYSIGRICDQAAIESALADERFTTVDWMRGVLQYKTQAMTHAVEHDHLHAWSSRPVRWMFRSVTEARQALRASTPPKVRKWIRTVSL